MTIEAVSKGLRVLMLEFGPLRGKNIFEPRPSNRDTGASYRFFPEFSARQARWWSQKIEIVCTKKSFIPQRMKVSVFGPQNGRWANHKKLNPILQTPGFRNHVNITDRNKDGCMSLTGWMIWLPSLKRNKLKSSRCYMYDNYPL